MKRSGVISLIMFIAIAALAVHYILGRPDLIEAVMNISPLEFFYLVLLCFLVMQLNGVTLKLLTGASGVHLKWREWGGLPALTTLANYIAPFSAGLLARAAYLKRRHDFSYTRFAGMLGATYLMQFGISGICGTALSIYFARNYPTAWSLGAIFFANAITVAIILYLPFKQKNALPGTTELHERSDLRRGVWVRLRHRLKDAALHCLLLRKVPHLRFRITLNILCMILINGLCFYFAFRLIRHPVSYPAALFISMFTMYATVINLTPGNFGVPETLSGIASSLIGSGPGEALMVTLLVRAGNIAVAFTQGPIMIWILKKELESVPNADKLDHDHPGASV